MERRVVVPKLWAIGLAALLTSVLWPVGPASSAPVVAAPPLRASTSAASPSGVQMASSRRRVVTVTCAGVGDLRVVVSSDAAPAPATVLPGGVSLRTAYRATDSRTSASVSGGGSGDIPCGEVSVRGVLFSALSSGPEPAGVVASDLFDGFVALSLVTSRPSLSAAPVLPGPGLPFPFAATLGSYLATQTGQASVAVFDATKGATYSYNAGTHFVTASIVKVAVLGTLLSQAQDSRRSLTSTERSLATRMIERSDNAATTTLWNQVGQGPGVGVFLNKVGMPATTPGPDGLWGLTSTTAPDQVRLVQTVAYPNAVLSDASRGYEESLMRGVIPSQKWGVSGGVPASAMVALKNGWLPRTGGWVVNSIGHVRGGTRDYVIAVLTSGKPSMGYGIRTVESVSEMVWQSDFSGDGFADLVARDSTGVLWLYPGNGAGGFLARRRMGNGWNSVSAIVTPGDVTGDGNADVLATDASGILWLYPGNGAMGLGGRRQVGAGWHGYTIAKAGDLNAAGRPDLLARDPAGALWLYPLSGNAVFGTRTKVGTGWTGYTILGPGDMSGDAKADILARDTAGSLWLYRGKGTGGVAARTLVSSGWSGTTLVAPGNWDRAGGRDLLARDAAGRLWVFPGDNTGGFGPRRQIGSGWSGMTFVG